MYFLFNFWKTTNSGNKFFFFFLKTRNKFFSCINTFFLNIFCFATLCLMHYDEEMK